MKRARNKLSRVAAGAAALGMSGVAMAHAGHGVEHVHWHATDVYGFVIVVVLATVALLFSHSE